MPGNFAPFEAKMRADGLSDAAVAAFKNAYDALTSGAYAALHLHRGAPSERFGAADITGRNHWPGGTRGALRCRCDADSTDDSRAMRAPPPRA